MGIGRGRDRAWCRTWLRRHTPARYIGALQAAVRTSLLAANLAAALSAMAGDDIALVRVGDSWRYFKGVSAPSNPASDWSRPGFNDSAWPAGVSGFSAFATEATSMGPTPRVRAAYFRRQFNVSDPATVQWLVLRLDYSSGFVAYLNGMEVARDGLADGPPDYNTYATNSRSSGAAQNFFLSAGAGLLVPGSNTLAIEVHTASNSPSSLVCVPELLANFQRGPFLGNVSTNHLQIIWHTPLLSDSAVEYGTDPSLGQVTADATPALVHVITLTGLEPNTRYYYRVRSSDGSTTVASPVFSFNTLKMAGPLVFAVYGDSGGGLAAQYNVAQVLAGSGAELVLHTGDLIYPQFEPGTADARLLSVYGPHMRSVPYFFTFGNHELYGGTDQYYLDTLYLPTNSATGTEHFYSFDHGDAHFVCLYLPTLTLFPHMEAYALTNGSTQYDWLTNDLAQTAQPWKFVFFHSPLVTSSAHRSDDLNANGIPDRFEIEAVLMPVLQRYGVQAVFNGHDHNYERFRPTNGVQPFVTGGGGYTLYDLTQRDALDVHFWKIYHCLKVTISDGTMRVEARDQYGTVFDGAIIRKTPPPPQVWPATWAVARMPAGPANDGDGNISGQTFDLAGQPIPAVAGQFSNLGELFVNNDADYLHIGLKRCMIGDGADIFLFIESPRLPGITAMAPLGNGVLDPADQGADGLDYLKNLGFTNFSPSVACILGDEFADGQFRAFLRPGASFAAGQGVFHLDSVFSDLTDARLQQYNLSPQAFPPGLEGYLLEQNADFIEILLPLISLGGVRPGDSIKLGALVGGTGVDFDSGARDLDSGFLGQQLHGSGLGPVWLEGVTVQLAQAPPFLDSDGDGLPDWWEMAYGLNPLSAVGDDGADGDPDGDGFTNLQEYEAGTDPTDAASALRLSVAVLTPQRLRLTWQTVPGRRYQLDYATSISGASAIFLPVPDPILPRTATSTQDHLDIDLDWLRASTPNLFFRARVVP